MLFDYIETLCLTFTSIDCLQNIIPQLSEIGGVLMVIKIIKIKKQYASPSLS